MKNTKQLNKYEVTFRGYWDNQAVAMSVIASNKKDARHVAEKATIPSMACSAIILKVKELK